MKNLLFPKNLSAIKILPRPSAAVIATARTSDMDDMDDMDIVNEKHSAKVKGPQTFCGIQSSYTIFLMLKICVACICML